MYLGMYAFVGYCGCIPLVSGEKHCNLAVLGCSIILCFKAVVFVCVIGTKTKMKNQL